MIAARSIPARRWLAAFTLVELMIAITIFSMIVVAIYSSWSAILRGSKAGMDAAAEVQRTRVAMRAIEEALASAVMYADNIRYYSFFSDTSSDFAALSFVARLPSSFPGSGLFGGQTLRRVIFEVQKGSDSKPQLVLMQSPVLEATEELKAPPYTIVLSRNISLFTMQFYDIRTNGWTDEWLFTNQLPRMVRVALAFGKSEGNQKPQDISIRTISLSALPIAVGAGAAMRAPGLPPGGIPPGGLPPGVNPGRNPQQNPNYQPPGLPPSSFPGGGRPGMGNPQRSYPQNPFNRGGNR